MVDQGTDEGGVPARGGRFAEYRVAWISAGATVAAAVITVVGASLLPQGGAVLGEQSRGATNGSVAHAKNGAGKGYFQTHGDRFYINDTRIDGHSAVLQWKAGSRQQDDWDKNGANNGWTVVNRDLPEGATVQYRACWGNWRTQYIELSSCSQWVTTLNNG